MIIRILSLESLAGENDAFKAKVVTLQKQYDLLDMSLQESDAEVERLQQAFLPNKE